MDKKLDEDMKEDMKFVLDVIDWFREKHDNAYITCHNPTEVEEISAHCTVSKDKENFFGLIKYTNGKYL